MENNNDGLGFGIASMVLGIVSILLCCKFILSLPCAIIGIVLGKSSIKKGGKGKGMGTAGFVLSIIAVIPAAILFLTGGAIISELSDLF